MEMSVQTTSTTTNTTNAAGTMPNKYIGSSTFSVQKLMNQRGALSSVLVIPCVLEHPLCSSVNIIVTAGGCGTALCFWSPVPSTGHISSFVSPSQTPTNPISKNFPQSKSQDQNSNLNFVYKLKYKELFAPNAAVTVISHLEVDQNHTSDKFVTGMADGTIKIWSALRCECTQVAEYLKTLTTFVYTPRVHNSKP